LFSRLPAYPASWCLASALNRLLVSHLDDDTLTALHARPVGIEVPDAGLRMVVCWNGQVFTPVAEGAHPDVRIQACTIDLLRLIRRQTDPDTLFFNRRLLIEGDTELGLLLKNTLDGIDPASLLPAWLPAFVKKAWASSPGAG